MTTATGGANGRLDASAVASLFCAATATAPGRRRVDRRRRRSGRETAGAQYDVRAVPRRSIASRPRRRRHAAQYHATTNPTRMKIAWHCQKVAKVPIRPPDSIATSTANGRRSAGKRAPPEVRGRASLAREGNGASVRARAQCSRASAVRAPSTTTRD